LELQLIAEFIDRLRLTAGTYITWIGLRIMPWPMNMLFNSYLSAIEEMPYQIAMGRTYGVLTAVWAMDDAGFQNALQMRDAATREIFWERMRLENETNYANLCGEEILSHTDITTLGTEEG
jgi:hypothetical protein